MSNSHGHTVIFITFRAVCVTQVSIITGIKSSAPIEVFDKKTVSLCITRKNEEIDGDSGSSFFNCLVA